MAPMASALRFLLVASLVHPRSALFPFPLWHSPDKLSALRDFHKLLRSPTSARHLYTCLRSLLAALHSRRPTIAVTPWPVVPLVPSTSLSLPPPRPPSIPSTVNSIFTTMRIICFIPSPSPEPALIFPSTLPGVRLLGPVIPCRSPSPLTSTAARTPMPFPCPVPAFRAIPLAASRQ